MYIFIDSCLLFLTFCIIKWSLLNISYKRSTVISSFRCVFQSKSDWTMFLVFVCYYSVTLFMWLFVNTQVLVFEDQGCTLTLVSLHLVHLFILRVFCLVSGLFYELENISFSTSMWSSCLPFGSPVGCVLRIAHRMGSH